MVSVREKIVTVGTSVVSITVTVALAAVVTPFLVPVIVYVVVSIGKTVIEPLASAVPIPWSIFTLSAPRDDQDRVCKESLIST